MNRTGFKTAARDQYPATAGSSAGGNSGSNGSRIIKAGFGFSAKISDGETTVRKRNRLDGSDNLIGLLPLPQIVGVLGTHRQWGNAQATADA